MRGREKLTSLVIAASGFDRLRQMTGITALAAALLTAGCADSNRNYGTGETVGTLSGAALGGWVGSQIGRGDTQLAATAAGALAGAFIGNQIGRGLDDVDRLKAEQAQYTATRAPIGEEIEWSNPNSGNHGSVVATREGTSTAGRYCREFQHTIFIDGRAERGYGTACREEDGTWEII